MESYQTSIDGYIFKTSSSDRCLVEVFYASGKDDEPFFRFRCTQIIDSLIEFEKEMAWWYIQNASRLIM